MTKKSRNKFADLIDAASGLAGGRDLLAHELGVSDSSLARWYSGSARPRPEFEGRLRAVAERTLQPYGGSQTSLFEWPDGSLEDRIRHAVTATCRALREAFHRRGRISSRQEALDELGKLLFSHVMSASHGGPGIGRQMPHSSGRFAPALRDFVSAQFQEFAPLSLAHEMKATDFDLRLSDTEEDLAIDLIACFDSMRETDLLASIRGRESIDVLNDAFGQFIADSFVQEKELGQYLTPNEVVRFMVRLGFSSIPSAMRRSLLDPAKVRGAGVVLDPSCGIGSFLSEALRVMYSECQKLHGADAARTLISAALEYNVVGIDKSERMLRLALTNLAMFGAGKVNLHLANSLARSGADGKVTSDLEGRAALILTNPPFGATFDGIHLAKYKIATDWVARRPRSVDSELLFLERYLDWLAPGGQLVAIVPDSILTNRGIFDDLRSALFERAEIQSVVSLPIVTFGVAGTSTKTSVLQLTKRPSQRRSSCSVFFAICDTVGYDVQTRGATRTKVVRGQDQLPDIFEAHQGRPSTSRTRTGALEFTDRRWDAVYNAGLSQAVGQRIRDGKGKVIRVRDVAELTVERFNPARLGADRSFPYIEISDVNGEGQSVRAKEVLCADAPSRARKRVQRGDVLVSTVRPERRTVGVVPAELDGAICSTGFAVLRCHGIRPLVLAHLLRGDFATEQIVKENSGIAYPAIEEGAVLDVVLPIDRASLDATSGMTVRLENARSRLRREQSAFEACIANAVQEWMQH